MVCACTTLGIHGENLFPATAGRDYALTPYLEPLAEFRRDFTVFSGISHPQIGGDHASESCFLTSAKYPTAPGFRNSISLDYAAARQPFLLSLHFNAPHWPWEGPGDEAESKRLVAGRRSLFDYDGGSMQTYAAMVTRMDYQIGRVLDALEAGGVANDTLVIFTSDNGGERYSDRWPFTGMKTELLEGGIRIPAIVRWPKRVPAGSINERQTIMHMDWLPTLLAAAGLTPDASFPPDGMNLLPTLTENAPPVTRKLFWRYKAAEQAAFRDGDWKYLKLGKKEWLFNLAEDEHERANRAQAEPARFAAMKQAWGSWSATMLPYPKDSPSANVITPDRY